MDVFPLEASGLIDGTNVILSGEIPEAAMQTYDAGRLVQGVFERMRTMLI